MKKLLLSTLPFCLCALTLANARAADDTAPTTPPAPATATAPAQASGLSIATSKRLFAGGETVEVQIVVTNTDTVPLTIKNYLPAKDFEFIVEKAGVDADGKDIWTTALLTKWGEQIQQPSWLIDKSLLPKSGSTASGNGQFFGVSLQSNKTLAPGQKHTVSFNLNRMFDLSMPGQYSVRINAYGTKDPNKTQETTKLTSQQLLIEIKP